jgi:hypothetical protein
MKFSSFRGWSRALLIAVPVLAVAIAAWIYFARVSGPHGPGEMLACLPQTGSTLVFADVGKLRQSGIVDLIAGARGTEDQEYRSFVESTGFDYRRDLDQLAGSFTSSGDAFFVLAGRFNWKKLKTYVAAQGGSCQDAICDAPVSQPGRFVSYQRLRPDLMAIAFSANKSAVYDIVPKKPSQNLAALTEPIWISVPAAALRDSKIPSGTRMFTSPLEAAENITLTVGPRAQNLEMDLDVTCVSTSAASDLLVKLEGATNTLRQFIEREHQKPNPRDLSGLLSAGTFRREDRRVLGSWPLRKELVEALASGSLN